MMDFSHLLSQGASSAWLFIPSAILLGALHGLEPGHSKTMMAAFIVAIRGTVGQAVLLGLSATLSHTAVVWAIALIGMYFGRNWNAASSEPWFQVASAVLIVGVAAWMIWRTWREQRAAHEHEHGHAHGHHHHDHDHDHDHHDHDHHGHDHHHADLDASSTEYQDAHERAHANDIRRRFANRDVTTGQIVMFGLTGGLVPCPASITVLLLCLQLKRFALGASLVLCFSIGLALTMVVSGTLAALSVKHVSKKWSGFGDFARKAPYFSGALILLVGLIVGYQGLTALAA
ncbi:nickel/cobalt efflux transporter [Paraburkholderia tropica]|uniref:nickel/cobalt efflux transporter n=1 Tax=Paraburkholderia tropica TaxID=92647 RepID=UPI002AB09140|nr:nickel/cobalt efflux transporter [Paraburkholderia tropica]